MTQTRSSVTMQDVRDYFNATMSEWNRLTTSDKAQLLRAFKSETLTY
jgi:hypothetical protein